MTSPMPLEESYKEWKEDALTVLEQVASTGLEFDAYTLQAKHSLRQPPNPQSHWGSLFRVASNRGLIEVSQLHRATRPASNGSLRPLWRGLPNGKAAQ